MVRGAADRSACAILETIAGKPELLPVIERDIQALFATGTFDDVVVARELDAGVDTLAFELTPRARLTSVDVARTASEPARAALRDVELDAPPRLDPRWVRASESRLQQALAEAGYRHAKVTSVVARDGADASVRFLVDEGPRALLEKLRFEGLRVAAVSDVKKPMSLKEGEPAADWQFERDRLVIASVLYDAGLLQCSVEAAAVTESNDGSRVTVLFRVTEGAVHHLREVRVVGEKQLAFTTYAPHLRELKRGSVFVRSRVVALVDDLEKLHAQAGAPATIQPSVDIVPGTTDVTLTLTVAPR